MPRIFYVTEKAWNYYPFTITEYTVRRKSPDLTGPSRHILSMLCYSLQCSFIPRFSILIKTKYENNPGTTENVSHY